RYIHSIPTRRSSDLHLKGIFCETTRLSTLLHSISIISRSDRCVMPHLQRFGSWRLGSPKTKHLFAQGYPKHKKSRPRCQEFLTTRACQIACGSVGFARGRQRSLAASRSSKTITLGCVCNTEAGTSGVGVSLSVRRIASALEAPFA